MAARITLTQLCYMTLDGQPQLVDIGSVIDVPDAIPYQTISTKVAESASAVTAPTSVRSVRKR